MRLEYVDSDLSLIETGKPGAIMLPVSVIASARRKLNIIRCAPNARSLEGWKSLGLAVHERSVDGRRFIRISNDHRMVFDLDEATQPPTVTILRIEEILNGEG